MRPDTPHERRTARAGFTLIEVLIASLIFAIGMTATIAMQYTALGGYANARDATRASDVGERVIHLLKQEAQQWQSMKDIKNMSTGVYKSGKNKPGYFASGSVLNEIATGTTWKWLPVFTEPVDVRLSDAGARRYCAYVRGAEIPNPTKTNPGRSSGILRLQVAVVYPGPNNIFPGGGPVGSCDESKITSKIEPKQWNDTSASNLELEGYRAIFMGTQIVLRNYLTEGGTYGS